eukprot:TRINITY_DN3967_c0_g2_i1.p1 TRINITY_DN3967_c0_g2~~TRINITY_DN3967_c0_g2_i1.p1  ORF type:complete len:313 (+),score=25.66 TRINITY_DN3967_c0_g2_i1:182-1120(+)
MFLLFMDEENAFWMIRSVIEDILPEEYYTPSMLGVETDTMVLKSLLLQKLPKVHNHLHKFGIDMRSVTLQWFLSLFVNYLPFECSIRFLDCLFFEGSKMLFRAGLTIFKMFEHEILTKTSFEQLFEYIKSLPSLVKDTKYFFDMMFNKLWLGSLKISKIKAMRVFYANRLKKERKEFEERAKQNRLRLKKQKNREDTADEEGGTRTRKISVEPFCPQSWIVSELQPFVLIENYLPKDIIMRRDTCASFGLSDSDSFVLVGDLSTCTEKCNLVDQSNVVFSLNISTINADDAPTEGEHYNVSLSDVSGLNSDH